MKKIILAAVVSVCMLGLSGCGFKDIDSDTEIVATTTTAYEDSALIIPTETTAPEVEIPTFTDPPEDSPYPAAMRVTANVNARKGASTADDIIQIIESGTEITVVGEKDGWYQIDLDGNEAYVIMDYVEEIPEGEQE